MTIRRLAFVAGLAIAIAAILAFAWPGFLRAAGLPRTELVFQGRLPAGGYRLFAIRSDRSRPRELSISIEGSQAFPRFSPDGKRLAFTSEAPEGRQDLFISDADGSSPHSIVPSPAEPIGAPSWSPDGAAIAFAWRKNDNWEIYSVGADGTRLQRLTNDPAADLAPVFSPDGRTIVFTSDRGGGSDSHLYAMNSDGTGLRQLTSGEDESAADFSPDGKLIAFVGFSAGNADLWIMNVDGSRPRRLTTLPVFEYDPRWSPDGRWLAFEGYERTFPDLYLMRADGTGRRRLTHTGRYAGNPTWRPRSG